MSEEKNPSQWKLRQMMLEAKAEVATKGHRIWNSKQYGTAKRLEDVGPMPKMKRTVQELNPHRWVGCGECDVSFPCYHEAQVCIRKEKP